MCVKTHKIRTPHKSGQFTSQDTFFCCKGVLIGGVPLCTHCWLLLFHRLLKIQSDKTRFQSAANCPSRAVFQTILDQMSSCAPTKTGLFSVCACFHVCVHLCAFTAERELKVRKRKHGGEERTTQEEADSSHRDTEQEDPTHVRTQRKRELLESRIVSSPFSEDYLLWKQRVIAAARAQVDGQEHDKGVQ